MSGGGLDTHKLVQILNGDPKAGEPGGVQTPPMGRAWRWLVPLAAAGAGIVAGACATAILLSRRRR